MRSSSWPFAVRASCSRRSRTTRGFEVASEDYHDVIDAGIDICLVASPHGLHYEHTKAALEAGAHVLCEKPFTVEPAHGWELVELANTTGRHLAAELWLELQAGDARRKAADGAARDR